MPGRKSLRRRPVDLSELVKTIRKAAEYGALVREVYGVAIEEWATAALEDLEAGRTARVAPHVLVNVLERTGYRGQARELYAWPGLVTVAPDGTYSLDLTRAA